VSATDPLLRTGELRDSISHVVDGRRAVVGSDDPVAIYQETGTSRIPPRPFLSTAAVLVGEDAAKAIGAAVGNAVAGRRD
jgi:phage gpG-like protein